MRRRAFILGLALLLALTGVAGAADVRVSRVEARQVRERLRREAAAEKARAEDEARENRQRILTDRQRLTRALETLKAETAALEAENQALSDRRARLAAEAEQAAARRAQSEAAVQELVGLVRAQAKDWQAWLSQSLDAGAFAEPVRRLSAIADQRNFPSMADLQSMADLAFDAMAQTGEVRRETATIIDRAGRQRPAEVLWLGGFTAAYRIDGEVGFLLADAGRRFPVAAAKTPSWRLARRLQRYFDGRAEAVPLDIRRGAALRQLAHRLDLVDHVRRGGPLVWPILLVLAIGGLIVVERLVFLLRQHFDADSLMNRLVALAGAERWDECRTLCRHHRRKPLPRVLDTGLDCRDMPRAELENALQEAILREIPPLERFLSTLGMLAAVAPLLGLLGTVTGMINTFQAITHFGTGDPRMMSGGISEALVTTMLGLSVAIPFLIAHTLLTRRVETTIAQLEEKAVAFVNLVDRARGDNGGNGPAAPAGPY